MKKINKKKFFSLIENKNLVFLGILLVFWWSFLSNINFSKSDIFHDRDGDELTDEEEYMYGTDVNNADSDGDGYRDGIEVESGFDPLKPAPGDKLVFKTEEDNNQIETEEETPNLTDDFFEKLQSEKNNELGLLNDYYSNPEKYNNKEEREILNNTSLTSGDLEKILNQTNKDSEFAKEMTLVSEDDIILLEEVTGSEKKVKKEEKEQVEKYLTQLFYIMATNRPFAIEEQELLPQLAVAYINEINENVQTGQIEQLSDLKRNAEKTYEECLEIETPYRAKDIQIKVLSIIKYLVENINEEKLIDQQDPMTIALYVGKLQAAVNEGEEVKNQIESLVDELEITVFSEDMLDNIS